MAKSESFWGLDIGQSALKALRCRAGDDGEHIIAEAFDFIEYPKILSQPDADPEELVRQALTTFLERNDTKGCRVAIAVPGQAGLVKFIKLPPVEKNGSVRPVTGNRRTRPAPLMEKEDVWRPSRSSFFRRRR